MTTPTHTPSVSATMRMEKARVVTATKRKAS